MTESGIAEHKKSGVVITAGTDGGVVFWNHKSNSTIDKIPEVGGKEVKLTGLILTESNLIVVSMAKKNQNLAFLPFGMRNSFDFVHFDGEHEEPVTSIKSLKGIPMFLTISNSRITRWWSAVPPRKLYQHTGENIVDADGGFAIQAIFIGTSDDKIYSKNMTSDKNVKIVTKAHGKGGVKGLVFMPHVNYIATSGGKEVKLWDKNLKLKETLKDSKHPVSKIMYKQSDSIIGVINKKGIVFWK